VARLVIDWLLCELLCFRKAHMHCALDWVRHMGLGQTEMGAPTRHSFYPLCTARGSSPVHGPPVMFRACVLFGHCVFSQGPHTLAANASALPAIVLFSVNCADADVVLALLLHTGHLLTWSYMS
jgi:hypothetical protein